jgi:hypothetical protein
VTILGQATKYGSKIVTLLGQATKQDSNESVAPLERFFNICEL